LVRMVFVPICVIPVWTGALTLLRYMFQSNVYTRRLLDSSADDSGAAQPIRGSTVPECACNF